MKKSVNTRYLVCYVGTVAVLFAAILGIGYYAGPAHLASNSYEEGMADILLSGMNVANPGQFDRGVLKRLYVSRLTSGPDVLLLGSSTSAMVRDTLFPGRSFFNAYSPAASTGDYMAILELYQQNGFTPSVVILGLDPWVFNGSSPQLEWPSLRTEYRAVARRLNLAVSSPSAIADWADKAGQLLSLPYFKTSLQNLFLHPNEVPYYSTDNRACDHNMILSDGSGVRTPNPSPPSTDDIEASVRAMDLRSVNLRFATLDSQAVRALEAFVAYMQSENIDVVFYLPPLHPAAYEIIVHSEECAGVLQTESHLRHLAADKAIQVIGGYDPSETSTPREEFFDYNHSEESAAVRAFAALNLP